MANRGSFFGGGQMSLLQLVNGLDKSRINPVIICPENGSLARAFAAMEINPVIVPMPSFRSLKVFSWIRSIIKMITVVKRNKIDCIHSNGSRASLYGSLVAKLSGTPLVAHFRVVQSDGLVDRFIALFASKVVVVSKAAGKRFSWLPNSKKQLIYNGVDTMVFKPGLSNGLTRQTFDLDDSNLVIAAVGRLSPEKGLETLLEAFGSVTVKITDAVLVLFGDGDSCYISELHKIVRKKKLKNVIFAGYIENIASIYPLIDILCLASQNEACNRSILEAMACEVPVIATCVGGNSELVLDRQSGYLVPPQDPEALSNALVALAESEDVRREMGKRGRERVKSVFSLNSNVRQTAAIYRAVLNRRENKRVFIKDLCTLRSHLSFLKSRDKLLK